MRPSLHAIASGLAASGLYLSRITYFTGTASNAGNAGNASNVGNASEALSVIKQGGRRRSTAAPEALLQRRWVRLVSAAIGFTVGGVALDVDHYLAYIWRTGDYSLRRAYQSHARYAASLQQPWHRLAFRWWLPFWGGYNRPLHSIPALLTLLMAALDWPLLRPLVAGAYFHRLLDFLWESFWIAQEHN